MKILLLAMSFCFCALPSLASAEVRLNGLPYLAETSPDDYIMQGGGGDRQSVDQDVNTRAQQYCTYTNRNSRLIDYQVSEQNLGDRFNIIDTGWVIHEAPMNLTRRFRGADNRIVGEARGFDSIRCR